MRAILAAAIMAALPGAAAQETRQFDLICRSGKTEVRYRVDLDRGEACSDQCGKTWKMGAQTAGELRIIDTVPKLRGDLEERLIVNRQTGDYRYFNAVAGLRPVSRIGHCEAESFSGFPSSKF